MCGTPSGDNPALLSDKELKPYVVAKPGGKPSDCVLEVIGLCSDHACPWLDTLTTTGEISTNDLHLITRDVVLQHSKAFLV